MTLPKRCFVPLRSENLRLCDDAGSFAEPGVTAAIEALARGFTEDAVDLPDDERDAAIAKVRVAWEALYPDASLVDDMPEVLRATAPRRAADDLGIDEKPGKDFLKSLYGKVKDLFSGEKEPTQDDFAAAIRAARGSAGGKASAKSKAKAKQQTASEFREHAERHPEPVAGCEYCYDYGYPNVLKFPKNDERASYRAASDDSQEPRCGTCRFYNYGSCSLVEGTIEYDYLCNLHLATPKTGPSMLYNVSDVCSADKPMRLFIELPKVS